MLMKLYMMVTNDIYELPLGVYDSLDEMAEKQGIKKAYIKTAISLYEHGKNKAFVPFRRIIIKERSKK